MGWDGVGWGGMGKPRIVVILRKPFQLLGEKALAERSRDVINVELHLRKALWVFHPAL